MKNFYLAAFILSVVCLLFGLPMPSDLSLTDQLVLQPENWTVTLNEAAKTFRNANAADAKVQILEILRANLSYNPDKRVLAIFGMSAFFSFLGWRREAFISRRLQR